MNKNIHNRHFRKLYNIFNHELSWIEEPQILEFRVSDKGMSMELVLKLNNKDI